MGKNKGLSLVELLITIAILSIVMVIAVSFMTTGSRSFAKGNADSNVQKEAELTVNQIEDMIIDVNGGVSMTDDADKTEMTMYHAEDDGTGTMIYTKEAVTWNKSDNNLYSSRWMLNYDSSINDYVVDTAATENYEDQLLAENVTSFEVDLSDTLTQKASDGTETTVIKSVLIRVGYEDGTGKVEYATSPVITLRNRMLLSDNLSSIFDEPTPAADTLKLYYSGVETAGIVPIVDRDSEVWRGSAYNIYARINSGSNVNDLVDWEIEETGTLSTIDDSGYLSVNTYEAHAYLTITAKYKSNPNKKATGVVKVVGDTDLKSLKSVHISTKSLTPFAPKYGSFVVTEGFTESEKAAITYKWTVKLMDSGSGRDITDVIESFTDNTNSLDLYIKKESENYGKVLEITLEAHSDVTGETVSDRVNYRIDNEGTTGGDSNMERGKAGTEIGYHGDNWYGFTPPFYDADPQYEYYFCDIYGNHISAYDYLKDCIIIAGGHGSYYVTFNENLPPDQEYYIKVIVYYHDQWNGTDWQYERIHYIPAVQLYGETNYSNATINSGCEFYYNVEGYYELAWTSSAAYEYSIEEFEYDAPAGVIVSGQVVSTQTKTESRIWAMIQFNCSDWTKANEVTLKSMKVKISLKGYPNIYTYSTIIFE